MFGLDVIGWLTFALCCVAGALFGVGIYHLVVWCTEVVRSYVERSALEAKRAKRRGELRWSWDCERNF